jgi:hypothetical protein
MPSDSDFEEEPESDAEDEASDSDYSAEETPKKRSKAAPAAKRPREEAAAPAPAVQHTRASLAALSHEELLDVAESLAKRVRALESKPLGVFPAKTTSAPQSAEAVQAQLSKVMEVAVKGIKAQMKWKQSCKAGTAKFSYDALITTPVAVALFKALNCLSPKEERQLLDASERKGVAKKIAVDAFETQFTGNGGGWRGISVSIRYGSLSLRGNNVLMRFDNTTGEFKVTGTYGV